MTLNKVGALILFSGLALTALQIRSCQSNRAWETTAKAATEATAGQAAAGEG